MSACTVPADFLRPDAIRDATPRVTRDAPPTEVLEFSEVRLDGALEALSKVGPVDLNQLRGP